MNAFSDIDALLRVISREKDILRFLFVSRKAPSLRREQALENFLSQDTRRLDYLLEHGVIREADGLLVLDRQIIVYLNKIEAEQRLATSGSRERYQVQFERYGKMDVPDARLLPLVSLLHRHQKGYDQEGYIE